MFSKVLEISGVSYIPKQWKSAETALNVDLRCLDDIFLSWDLAEAVFTSLCSSATTSVRHLLVRMATNTRVVNIHTASTTVWAEGIVYEPQLDIKPHLVGCNRRCHIDQRALRKRYGRKITSGSKT